MVILLHQKSLGSNEKQLQHSLSAYSMAAIGGDKIGGQILGAEYAIQKGWYGAMVSYSHYIFNDKHFPYPLWPADLYIPNTYSSRLISFTPYAQLFSKNWFSIKVNAGFTYSREDYLYSYMTQPIERTPGNLVVLGDYYLDRNNVFGYTFGVDLDFRITQSFGVFVKNKYIIMNYPGIGQVLLGGGIRFSI